MRKPSKVTFINENLQKEFFKLDDGDEVKKYIFRAISDIKINAFCGTQIPKRLIPQDYVKRFGINNLWKYDLPDGWRLIYSITTPNKVEIISLILEWFNHKNYERRFRY